jgi:hypothetical protein
MDSGVVSCLLAVLLMCFDSLYLPNGDYDVLFGYLNKPIKLMTIMHI